MARGWVSIDSEIAPLELPDSLKTYSLAIATEKALELNDTRENILLTAAHEVELYIGRMIFLGDGGSARVCTSVLETDSSNDVPAIPLLPHSHPITVTNVLRWSDDAGALCRPLMSCDPSGGLE